LEEGAFKWPPIMDGVMRLSPAQLAALTWISHAREKISPLVGISESDQTISGEKL
jgi:transposase